MAKISPLQFFRQVRQEVKKVTWPTRKEVMQEQAQRFELLCL